MSNEKWLYDTLTRIDERQAKQAELLATLNALMSEHMKRTDALERDIKPLKEHVAFVGRASRVLLGLGSIAATLHSVGLF